MRSIILSDDIAQAMLNLLPEVKFDTDRMKEATSPELFATQIALEKVLSGMPFRDAYREAAKESENGELKVDGGALDAYLVEGYPGQTDTAALRTMLASFTLL